MRVESWRPGGGDESRGLRAALRRVAQRGVAAPAAWRLLRPVLPACVGLMYHRVAGADALFPSLSVEVFRAQMRWLRDNCHVLDPDELPLRGPLRRPAKPAVVVTFDDGYRDYHDYAYPVLREFGIPCAVFLATGFMDDPTRLLWSDRLFLGVQRTRRPTVALPWTETPFELSDARARGALLRACKRHLKALPDEEKERQAAAVLLALDAPLEAPRQMLSWEEIRSSSDLTRWGGHTHTHRILSRVSPAESEAEIATCRDRIAVETGRAPRGFAYPNGQVGDFDATTQAQLQAHGFEVAYAASDGTIRADTDWLAVPRLSGDTASVEALAWRIARAPR